MADLDSLKREIELLAAENMAVQLLLLSVVQRLGRTSPEVGKAIRAAFEDAANNAESMSILAGGQAGHLPETLRIIEKLRLVLVGEDKPKREI